VTPLCCDRCTFAISATLCERCGTCGSPRRKSRLRSPPKPGRHPVPADPGVGRMSSSRILRPIRRLCSSANPTGYDG